jgi:Tol biopolymer transport system component
MFRFLKVYLPTLILGLAVVMTPLAGLADEDDQKEGLALEPTRTVEFETDEVTWLSVDVSPDGSMLALEILGDLYTLPIEGGAATRITEGLAFDSQPSFSPDGEWIAYLSDHDGGENLWIARTDGSDPKQLSKESTADFASPTWSADGDYALTSRTGPGFGAYEIWMYHVKGGSGLQITKAKPAGNGPRSAQQNSIGVQASPDGRYLYYATKSGGFAYNLNFPQWQIARKDLMTGVTDTLTQAAGSAIRPVLSPDGTLLVYGTRFDTQTGLRVRDLTTGEDRWLKYPVQRDDQESRFTRDTLPGYAFMPDGSEIVVSFGGKLHRVAIADGASTEIPFTAQVSQKLGPQLRVRQRVEEGPLSARLIQDPSQSPDGTRLAFSGLTHLYTMALPDGEPQRVTSGEAREFQPTWSPDGESLAFVTWTAEGGHLWKVSASGGAPVRLTEHAAYYSDPVFSPDGERIVALRASAHERVGGTFDFGAVARDVVWLPAEGGEMTTIVPSQGIGKPHFTDDPERIYAYLSGGLVSFRYDGTDRRSHLDVKGPAGFSDEPGPAADVRMSPDGKWALAHVGNQLYLVTLPIVGGETPSVNVSGPSVPIKKLTTIGADYFGWADGGETMTWAVGPAFFRQPIESVSFEEEKEEEAEESEEPETKKSRRKKKKAAAEEPEEKPEKPPLYEEIRVTLEAPRHTPEGTVVLSGARIVTMKGDEVIESGDVVVTDNRIVAVGAAGEVEIPEGASVKDVSGKTIVPGFIDTHAHWFEIRRGIMDSQNWSFLANLAYGVTAGLDVQTATNDMFAYQDLVDTGDILGPRAYSTGPGVFSDNNFQDLEQTKGVLKRYREYYGTQNLKAYMSGNRKQRQLVAEASKEVGMMPTTEGALDLKLDLTHVLDGFAGNEHSIPIVPLYKDVVELIAQSGTAYTPTLLVLYGGPWAENYFYTTEEVHDDEKLRRFVPHRAIDEKTQRRPWFRDQEHAFSKVATEAGKILRAGGLVGVGSHGQLQGLGFHWELWSLASGDLTEHEALRAATLVGAEVIGFADDLGSIEPGKMADMVILDGNPLEDIRNTNTVHWVMKNGEIFEGESLDQVWPVKRELEPLWWWDEDPEGD